MTGATGKGSDRHPTEKARAASIEARRRLKDSPELKQALEVFVTRVQGGKSFGWEVRQFGGVVLQRGETSFDTHEEAHADGSRALLERLSFASSGTGRGSEPTA